MPFNGFICESTGQHVAPDFCVSCALKGAKPGCHLTAPIARGIAENSQDRGLSHVSVTELLGCPRKVVLQKEHPYWVKPSQAYWLFRGQLGHALIEQFATGDDMVAEQRMEAEIAGLTITGQPDVFYPRRRHLEDYKTTKSLPGSSKTYTCRKCQKVIRSTSWKVRRGEGLTCKCGATYDSKEVAGLLTEEDPKPYSSHTAQVNAYRLILARNNVRIDTAEIVYLDMSGVLRVPVPLWSLDETERFLTRMIERLQSGWIPAGVQDDDEARWQCEYCPVAEVCAAMPADDTAILDLSTTQVGKAEKLTAEQAIAEIYF